jgi:hypothetical protein
MREERYAEAADWFEQSIRTGLATPQMLIWYMESLSNLGRLQDLRLLARTKGVQWTIEGGFSPEVPDMVRLWAQGYHPEKDPLVSRLAS